MSNTPRVYIVCLASYNNGILHGKWAKAVDADDLNEAIADVIKTSPQPDAEEWALHDYENFYGLESKLGENPDVELLCAIGAWILSDGEPVAGFLDIRHVPDSVDDVLGAQMEFQDSYQGTWADFDTYAEYVFDYLYLHDVPEQVHDYIDYEKFARSLSYDGYAEHDLSDGNVAIFNMNY